MFWVTNSWQRMGGMSLAKRGSRETSSYHVEGEQNGGKCERGSKDPSSARSWERRVSPLRSMRHASGSGKIWERKMSLEMV